MTVRLTVSTFNRFWFYFTVENTQADQKVIFNIVNLSKSRSLYRTGLTPVVKSSRRKDWQRIPLDQVFYYCSKIHHDFMVLTFVFAFDRDCEKYSFALAHPYSFSRHSLYLERIMNRGFGFLKRRELATSVGGKPIDLLTIGNPQHRTSAKK